MIFFRTHSGRVTHICFRKLTIIGSDNYLNQCWNIVTWTHGNLIGIHENAFENVACEMASFLSRPQCVNRNQGNAHGYKIIRITLYNSLFKNGCYGNSYKLQPAHTDNRIFYQLFLASHKVLIKVVRKCILTVRTPYTYQYLNHIVQNAGKHWTYGDKFGCKNVWTRDS